MESHFKTREGRGRRGPFGSWGPPFGGGRWQHRQGGRARRGDVRAAMLALLAERPMHGYEVIQELGERTGGVWQPSPGSVYPTLQLLEDEGLVTSVESEGRRRFSLTDDGRAEAEKAERPPWEQFGEDDESGATNLRDAAIQLGAAVMQVARVGSQEQAEKVRDLLNETRKRVYGVLSENGET